MLDFANSSIDVLIFVLRIAVVLLLYFFLWQVLRFVLRAGQSGVAAGKIFPLGPSNIIGRSMENCEIALNDTFLSSQHARLELQGDVWVLEDLHSTNGTFVNEIEVRDATSLEEGDILRVGRVEMRLSR